MSRIITRIDILRAKRKYNVGTFTPFPLPDTMEKLHGKLGEVYGTEEYISRDKETNEFVRRIPVIFEGEPGFFIFRYDEGIFEPAEPLTGVQRAALLWEEDELVRLEK